MPKLNFVFFGTPDVGRDTLEILKSHGFLPSLVVASPDKPQGRGMINTPPPTKVWAQENNIPCFQPEKLNKKDFEKDFDLFVVVAYGKILPEEVLNLPKHGSINIHYSLLPKYRGASPVESAILNGEQETGVTIQKMEYKMDAGAIIAQEKTKILENEKTDELRKRLIVVGAELLVKILPDFLDGKIKPSPQEEGAATFTKKIKKEDGLVDLGVELPSKLYAKFRAYTPWPRIFFMKDNKRIIITDAEIKDEQFVIKKVIPEGKKEITWKQLQEQEK